MIKGIRYCVFVICIMIGINGYFFHSLSLMLLCTAALFLNNVLFCLENLKSRMYLLVFHITIFVFVLGKPLIQFYGDEKWWKYYVSLAGEKSVWFSVIVQLVSLTFLFVGGLLGEHIKIKKQDYADRYHGDFSVSLRGVSLIVYLIGVGAMIVLEAEKLLFMRGKSYVEYYSSFSSHMPYLVHLVASFMQYALCIYLSTLPKKRDSYIVLGIYVVSAIPALIIGMRNPVMLNVLFSFLYFCLRDVIGDREKWVSRFEKGAVVAGTVPLLGFMTFYSKLRTTVKTPGMVVGGVITNFVFWQGITYNVLNIGYKTIDRLPDRKFRNYTFGGFIDYITHGSIAQKYFGAQPFPEGNSVLKATEGNALSHAISYFGEGKNYLGGEGWGSSYFLETYIDYGYIGVAVYSMVVAILLVLAVKLIKKNLLISTMVLLILSQIFFAPRGQATGSIEFLGRMNFWMVIFICFFGAKLFQKKYYFVRDMEDRYV